VAQAIGYSLERMLGGCKGTSMAPGLKALRGVDEHNLALLRSQKGQQRLGQGKGQAKICPVQGVELLNWSLLNGSSRVGSSAVDQYVKYAEFPLKTMREAIDGAIASQIYPMDQYGASSRARNLGDWL
jgi:hypothetical protein